MAKFVLKSATVTVNSVDLSDHISKVTVETQHQEVDVTSFGDTYREILSGMGDATITLDFFQDFATAKVDATLWTLADQGTTFPVTVKPTSAAVSSTNPRYDMTGVILQYHPIVTLVHFGDPDIIAHGANWQGYLTALRLADSLTWQLWSAIQADPVMSGKTTIFVTNDHANREGYQRTLEDYLRLKLSHAKGDGSADVQISTFSGDR